MDFFKRHWFGLLLSLVVFVYFAVFLLVLFAPRDDEQKRGFSKCSSLLLEDITNCQKNAFCTLGSIMTYSGCNFTVVGEGLKLWLLNQQKNPWDNYFFEQKISSNIADDDLAQLYEENPELRENFDDDLIRQYKNLEMKVLENEK